MKHLAKAAIIAAAIGCTVLPAHAKSDINPWMECGIGAMIFPDNQTAAAISNIIWDLGTTAVTSAQTSRDQCKGSGVSAAMFVQATYPSLSRDTAIGEGEFLNTLLDQAGCDTTARPQLVADLRSDFAAQASDAKYVTISDTARAEQYFLRMRTLVNGQYADQCKGL